MIPSESFLTPGASRPVGVPPPHGFRPLELPLRNVSFSISAEFFRQSGNTTSREGGLRYEFQVHNHLKQVLGANYLAIEFEATEATGKRRRLIPDGVFFCPDYSILFEVKSQHMPEAWWQLRRLYQPTLEFKRPGKPCYVVEVCRSYDPGTPFPEPTVLIDLPEWFRKPTPEFAVYHWKP